MNMMTSNMNQMNITERPVDLMNGRENLIGPEPYAPRPIKYQARGFGMFQKKKLIRSIFMRGKYWQFYANTVVDTEKLFVGD